MIGNILLCYITTDTDKDGLYEAGSGTKEVTFPL